MNTAIQAGSVPRRDTRSLANRLTVTRRNTERLAAPLSPEDQVVQSMTDCSPTKWHLGHVSWFFETFLLTPHLPGYKPFDPLYTLLFNSYYVGAGPRHPRPQRGMLTRPPLSDVMAYRAHVDRGMEALLATDNDATRSAIPPLIELGLNHEQQHQELLLMDILNLFSLNPGKPTYASGGPAPSAPAAPFRWIEYPGGIHALGHDGEGFAFDNESPRHDVLLHPFQLGSRPVTNGEWIAFIEEGGYGQATHWLSDGFATVQAEGWAAPLYWEKVDGSWHSLTLHGFHPVDPNAPVDHVSYYEAEAFARWSGNRLPTEAEWEVAAADLTPGGNTLGTGALQPRSAPATDREEPIQMFGDVWEWTASPYGPYPGFRPPQGTVGEYNGKFMANQMILRGGCCVTPDGHIRATYRNFFYPHQRWAFSGLRLARNV
ncbi:MAG: ergothioneine biosynthesis protein EgtB [Rhodospirillum sp.]|nr:ergothioneine biosynthesis protein EgtB [Rhodospirillum sp.]MCF8488527.1 ergothioneine biosynthesis protein EgtB [Rhodospirillum sp.]MCF8499272.1 ergothioneine biosynthesis protein EgtB [Rhodospirillum sp.]